MIGFFAAIIIFNLLALLTNKRLSKSEVLHIWTFTIAVQAVIETFIDFKYHGYWYFTKEINWFVLPALTVLIPPVNIIFLNLYPFNKSLYKQVFYIICWTAAITLYELIAILPEPWGYFRYGWWRTSYSFAFYPLLLLAVVSYYKWIYKIQKQTENRKQK